MNETIKKQVQEASYCFYDNYIYKISLKTPKLNKITLCECEITHKININNIEHIYFTNYTNNYILKTIRAKDYKRAIFYNNFDKYLIYENNKYILSDIINTLETHVDTCNICYDIKLLTQSLYECSHNNICIECSINWNKDFFNNCPICRAENNFREIVKNKINSYDAIYDVKKTIN